METLLRCPFCGGVAAALRGMADHEDAFIRCTKCEAEGPLFVSEEEHDDNAENAAAHWNNRI